MDSQESNRREVGQFFGLVKDISPYDAPWGSFTELVNLHGNVPGEIRTRKGYAPADGFTTASPNTQSLISLAAYDGLRGPTAITFDTSGYLKYRRNGFPGEIKQGLVASVPLRSCRTRDGQMIFVNGLDRGVIWRGTDTVGVNLGVDAPTQTLTSTLGSGGGLSEGTYLVAYRYRAADTQRTDPVYSAMSAAVSYSATDGQKFTHNLTTADNPTGRGTYIEVWRTTSSESSVFYYVGEDDLASASSALEDTLTDQALIDAAATDPNKVIPLRGRYGAVMRRQAPPPTTKAVAIAWMDRVWYGVDGAYDTGTVSISSGDATLTGSGTTFLSHWVGRYVWIDDSAMAYKILTYTSATSLELSPTPAESLSGKTYRILPDPAERNQTFYSAYLEPESVHPTFTISPQPVPEDSGSDTALMPHGGALFIFRPDHAYAFTFSKEPNYDGSARHAFARGCLNQACWDQLDGVAYVLDKNGAYAVGPGGGVEPISDVVQSYWRDGTIDFDKAKWFSVNANPIDRTVRFFVNFTTDTTATRPCRALTYHTLHRVWGEEYWPNEWAGAVRFDIDGATKTVVGGLHDRLYFLGDGELDGCDTEHSGTVTSATATTLTNSGASFGASDGLIGASVAIYAGTGFGQVRRITANTGTALTVPAWTTTPDTTSKYAVGGARYVARTSFQPIIDQAKKESEPQHVHLTTEPITDDRPMHVREWYDFDTTAATLGATGTSPDGLVSWTDGSTDKIVSLHKTAKTNDAGTGTNRGRTTLFSYGKSGGARIQGKSCVAIELEGIRGNEQIKVHRLAISGTGK